MQISETEAREWYESNGISNTDWSEFAPITKQMLAVEAIASEWDVVVQMRETGIPESAVLIYFDAEACGLDPEEVHYLGSEASYEGLTSYIIQNTTSEHVSSLFEDRANVTVLSVDAVEMNTGLVTFVLEVEGDETILN